MKPGLDQRTTGTVSLAATAAGKWRTKRAATAVGVWAIAVAVLFVVLAAPTGAQAQQPYGYPYASKPPAGQYPAPYQQPYAQPGAPNGYAQPQYQAPQYAAPQYGAPQYGAPQDGQPQYQQPPYGQPQYAPPQYQQPAYPQMPNGYAQQPDGQYADPSQAYGQPYGQGPDQGLGGPDMDAGPAGPTQAPLSAGDLEQLLAPVALDPDNLLAQILAASTYPAQVAAADQWVHQMQAQGYGSPDQIAAGAQAQGDWDPSVKGLTAFPQTLDMLNQNLQWTTALGNAYYNQPQDVMQTVQVLRERAQQAGNLQSTPQEDVTQDQGYIDVAPSNPAEVYVPSYNPWDAYGAPISPYPGFSALSALGSFVGGAFVHFGPGIAMAAFDRFPFGWIGWALNWLGQSISFNHSAYATRSNTVADWGFPHGGQRVFGQRRGFGNGYRGPQPYDRGGGVYAAGRGDSRGGQPMNGAYGRGFAPARPEAPGQGYNRMPSVPTRPQPYANGEGFARTPYGSGYSNRPGMGFANGNPGYRSPAYQAPAYRPPAYAGRGYQAPPYREPSFRQQAPQYRAPEMNSSRAFGGRNGDAYGAFAHNEHEGGFHPFSHGGEPRGFRNEGFGGGHASRGFGHERAPKAPKEGHSGGGGHGHRR
jgi:hypothetical protein